MKTLLTIILLSLSTSLIAQTAHRGTATITPAKICLYKPNDTVGVKDSRDGYRIYIITSNGYHRNSKKQVMYDCVDMNGREWYYLPELGIKQVYKFKI